METPPRALEGLPVLDQTQAMAGPFCAMLLADVGPEVRQLHPAGGGVEHADHARAVRLGLEGNDAGAQPAEGCDAVSDVGADIESEIAGPDEAPVQPVHRRRAGGIAVVDLQRAPERRQPGLRLERRDRIPDHDHRSLITKHRPI